jgi:hypothetical protein
MITCPMCRQSLPDDARKCGKCLTDLSLLADYVTHLRDGLQQADRLTRAGELGEAVWAYLAVLEVDPDNATARRQVGRVVSAVRQFDDQAPGRRWQRQLRPENQADTGSAWTPGTMLGWLALVVLYLASVLTAYYLGARSAEGIEKETSPAPSVLKERERPLSRDRPELGK